MKQLRGTYRAHREVSNEMQPEVMQTLPAAPESLTEYGQGIWYKCASKLFHCQILSEVDLEQLELYCYLHQLKRVAQAEIEEHGITIWKTTDSGPSPMKNPAVATLNQVIVQINSLSAKLGFTPADRAKIEVPEQPAGDPIEKLISESLNRK